MPSRLELPGLSTRALGRPTHHFHEVDSTQDRLLEFILSGSGHGTVCLADVQHQGRGRNGRSWFSPQNALLFSVCIEPDLESRNLPFLSIVAGVAMAQTIEKFTSQTVELKWPNDVLVRGRKIAGILADAHVSKGRAPLLLLGVGCNISGKADDFPSELRGAATSLESVAAQASYDRLKVLSAFLNHLEDLLPPWSETELQWITDFFNSRWCYRGQQVRVELDKGRHVEGRAGDIAPNGAMNLETKEGQVLKIFSADVIRLRKET